MNNIQSKKPHRYSSSGSGAQKDSTTYQLRLYITGATYHSMLAVKNIKALSEKYLKGSCSLEIIDIYQQPQLATEMQIIATPTLIKLSPLPIKRLIGDMSDTRTVLASLNIQY